MVDHYQVLGVNRNATKQEVKEAFRRLAVKYHPDKHTQSPDQVRQNATVRFRLVSEAYEVLNDDRKRASYNAVHDSDRFRRTSGSYSNPNGNRGSGSGSGSGSWSGNSGSWSGSGSGSGSGSSYSYGNGSYSNPYGNRGSGSGSGNGNGYGSGNGYGYSARNRQASSLSSRFESTFRSLPTRVFLLNLALFGGLLFAFTAVKMRNSGKSFEEAMDSLEKTKVHKDEG